MGKTIDIGGRIHNPEVGNVVTGANEILDDTKGKKQNVINSEVDSALEALDANKQDNLTFDQTPTESSTNPVTSGGVYAADLALQQAIEAILTLIPSAASALNQLADKSFVNSSIATASATFRGTYNLVSDLHLSVTASYQDIATALASVVSTADNNDYCFVQIPTSDTSSDIRVTERYKFNGTAWAYEYDLNNSGFTAQQWEAINSGITALLVQKLGALPTAAELATSLAGKQNVLTFDNVPTSGSDNPVKSGGLYQLFAAIDAKMPSDASANNKLVAENRLAAYVTAIIEALDASFDVTSTDGHVTFRITQTNGQIASVQILTSDIASASALTTLTGRVSTNETDIANLQAAYAALTQSDVIIVNGALPSSGQQQNKIYRQPDPDHTPPQFYSDYMWNGSTWVLMATYNNAIDPRPKKGSQNLVTSGGVFDNMGALDVSELNATESPHTLATYADLSAALAAIPSDYQKGGMSIKFVQSSDNKYVQYRLMAQTFTTDTTQWQGVDDEPTAGSDNLVKSGGVAAKAIKIVGFGQRSDGDSGITGVGQVYYNTSTDKLYVCTSYRSATSFDQEEVPYLDGAIYTYQNKFYVWDGNKLSLRTPTSNVISSFDFHIQDENDNVILYIKGGEIRTKKFDSSKIDDLLNSYKNKKISILGDSISTFGDTDATNQLGTYCYSYYPAASCRYSVSGVDSYAFDVNNTWWMSFIKKVGGVLGINDSYRGSSISNIVSDKPSISSQSMISHLGLNGTPDLILVFGGANDIYNNAPIGTFDTTDVSNYTDEQIANMPVTTFADACKAMLTRLLKTYPLSEVVCLLPTFATSINYTMGNLDDYVEVMKESCDFFGVKYIDIRTAGFNPFNASEYLYPNPDGIHPNAKGMALISSLVYKSLIF